MNTRKARAVLIHPADNVATALAPVPAGGRAQLEAGGTAVRVEVCEEIPAGHKFSVRAIARGETIVKYGEPIGRATADIPAGRHVHVHNVESERGRGDRPGSATVEPGCARAKPGREGA